MVESLWLLHTLLQALPPSVHPYLHPYVPQITRPLVGLVATRTRSRKERKLGGRGGGMTEMVKEEAEKGQWAWRREATKMKKERREW